ncbi:MAG: ribonuclease III [Pseudomonadota bacterium]
MTKPHLPSLETIIGYTFKTPTLLEKALAHPSAKPRNKDFERFEFLGDRVLGLTMAAVLLELFPNEPEGHLAKRQAVLVSRESCQTVAGLIQLETYIHAICDSGVHASNMMAILADAVESLLGAMYLDGGIDPCHVFVRRFWADLFHDSKEPPKDAKSSLQEWLQKRGKPTPVYTPIGITGPAHNPTFECELQLTGLPTFNGTGRNRRMAEQDAAKAAMEFINNARNKLK